MPGAGVPDAVVRRSVQAQLQQFHSQLQRALLIHRRGRMNLFFKLQFPQVVLPFDGGSEVMEQLDLAAQLPHLQPLDGFLNELFSRLLQDLAVVLVHARNALQSAVAQNLGPPHLVDLLSALRDFDRTSDRLVAALTAELTEIDNLTGLLNRVAMQRDLSRELEQLRRSGRTFVVAMIDADNFKAVNDTHGHDFGDIVLSTVAECLVMSVRANDRVYRFGGEEFLILMPDSALSGVHGRLEQLRLKVCTEPIREGTTSVHQSVSIGATEAIITDDLDTLIRRADQGLLSAKTQGRNRIVFLPFGV
jgi:diguanylate cyclase (GGDEF)-like protein